VRMGRIASGLAVVALALAAVVLPSGTGNTASASTLEPASGETASSGHWGVAPATLSDAQPALASASVQVSPLSVTAGSCVFDQALDNPHTSGGEVSVHGWWLYRSGTCPSKAKVSVWLQAYWQPTSGAGYWVTVTPTPGTKTVFAGGGSVARANVRTPCVTSGPISWRGRVDVDLINWNDPSGYTYSYSTLRCAPC